MKKTYEVADRTDRRAITEFLKRGGQFLLPMVELVEQAEFAIDGVIEVIGRATIEAVLDRSAEGVAGPKQAGKSRAEGEAVWYGRQAGQVAAAQVAGADPPASSLRSIKCSVMRVSAS